MSDFALCTVVADIQHLTVLDDWLKFLGTKPSELVVCAGPQQDLAPALQNFSDDHEISLNLIVAQSVDEIKYEETKLLIAQFEAAKAPFMMVVRLDALPYRAKEDDWFAQMRAELSTSGALFFTGSSLPYRSDKALDGTPYFKTVRVSNNFLFIGRQDWLDVQQNYPEKMEEFGRYATEGVLEWHCTQSAAFGLRRMNTPDWRVFHTQVWDDRAVEIREAFLSGHRIAPYLKGFQDDILYDWQAYYLHPAPSIMKRIRIAVGRVRRNLLAALRR